MNLTDKISENKYKLSLAATTLGGLMYGMPVHAQSGGGATIVSSAIETAVGSVTSEASKVIAGAVGLGAIFWGAQVLWTKFKSMAK